DFKHRTIATVLELRVEVIGIEAGEAKLRDDVVKVQRRNTAGQIVIHAGDPAGVSGNMFGQNFRDAADQPLLGAIDGHNLVHAPKWLIGVEGDVVTDTRRVSANKAAFEPHANIVEHFLLVIDHGATEQFVAKRIGSRVQ